MESLISNNHDALYVTNPYNIRYLSGFRGVNPEEREVYLLLTKKKRYLIAPRLYEEEARRLRSRVVAPVIASERNKLSDCILNIGKDLKIKRLGVEAGNITLAEYDWLKKKLGKPRIVPVDRAVEKGRLIKTEDEIKKIKKAQRIGEEAVRRILGAVRIGITELAIAERLETMMKSLGAEKPSFPTIVAFGRNAALPHYQTGTAKIKKGGMLLFDFGAKYKGYCGDMTRTVFIGKPTQRFLKIYHLVQAAQEYAIKKCGQGMRAHDIHLEAHALFEREKVHDNFTHGLGHGVGLEVHEAPHLRKDSKDILKPGMVFSGEPGLYFPGWGGVRIEDLVVLRSHRAEVLRRKTPFLINKLWTS